jgi:hypothetical protein
MGAPTFFLLADLAPAEDELFPLLGAERMDGFAQPVHLSSAPGEGIQEFLILRGEIKAFQ